MKRIEFVKIFTLFLLFLSCTGFGQTSDSNAVKKIVVGFTFSPDYCYRTLYPSSGTYGQVIADMRDTMEIPRMGFTSGVSLLYQINKLFTLESGLKIADRGEKTHVITLVPIEPDPNLPSNKVVDTYHFLYLNIPLLLNYKVGIKNPEIFLSAGFSTGFFIKQWTTVKYIGAHKKTVLNEPNDCTKINLSAMLGFGVNYQISKKFSIRFQPLFSYSITPVCKVPLKEYHYSLGANMGLYYQLK